MGNSAFQTMRAYGAGAVSLRGGFLPYGSAAGSSALPVIPTLRASDPTGGDRPQFAGFWAAHDGDAVGLFRLLLDQDYQDLIIEPTVEVNDGLSPATLFLPSATSGKGLTLFSVALGPSPLTVVYANASGSSTTVVENSNIVTVTPQTSGGHGAGGAADNSDVAAAINASTVGIVASLGDTDLAPTAGAGPYYFSGGASGRDVAHASAFVPSDTVGDGVTFTAVQAGMNDIRVIYVYSGTSVTAAVVSGHNITITIPTSVSPNTNESIVAAVSASAAASALIVASAIGAADTNTTTTKNLTPGAELVGGSLTSVVVSGRVNPKALGDSGITNMEDMPASQQVSLPGMSPYAHFALRVYLGDSAVDLTAQAQVFIPSATQGSGIMLNSIATSAVQASCQILSSLGAAHGITYTAVQPGAEGNGITVVYETPYATLFIPSTTAGEGIHVQANTQFPGTAGQQISVSMAAPNASLVTCQIVVNGLSVSIFPQSGNAAGADTNTTVLAALNGNPQANALAVWSAIGGSDLVTGNFNAKSLGGGYSLAAGVVTAEISGDPTSGYAVSVQFGSGSTNTQVAAAVSAAAVGQFAVVTAAVIGSTGSDTVIATGATSLAGGSDPSELSAKYVGGGATAQLTAQAAGNATILAVASTSDFPSAGTLNILNSAGNVIQVAYTGTTSTTFTGVTGGSSAYTFASGTPVYLDAPFAVQGSVLCTVFLGYTVANNTNAKISAAINEAQPTGSGGALLSAVAVGTTTDLNPVLSGGTLAWNGSVYLECDNIIRFAIRARNSTALGA